MAFVLRMLSGNYVSARKSDIRRYSAGSPDLQKATTFKRRCDATNTGIAGTILEVELRIKESA